MANILNQKIREELTDLFNEADECLMVDFTKLSVEEINSFRASLTEKQINMQVIKVSLADLVFKDQERTNYEEMLKGPTAVIWGGDSIVQISKSVNDFAKKTKKLKIKGGLLGKESIDVEAVKKLTTVPDTPILMGMIVNSFMDPLQGIAGGINMILSSVANLIDALKDKREGEAGQE